MAALSRVDLNPNRAKKVPASAARACESNKEQQELQIEFVAAIAKGYSQAFGQVPACLMHRPPPTTHWSRLQRWSAATPRC